ncbi:MAG: hypothetical protein AAF636_28300 [Pseudomonadota bacterium]
MNHVRKSAAAALLAVSIMGSQATAEEWEFKGSFNLWGAGVEGTTAAGAEIDVDFGDILENLEFSFQGTLEAKRGKFVALADIIYIDVGTGAGSTRPLIPGLPGGGFTIDAVAKADVESTIVNVLGGYELLNQNGFTLQGLAGARYVDLDTTVNLALSIGPLQRSAVVRANVDSFDAIVGMRGEIEISENWFVPYYFDIGTGESDFTWQAFAGVGYDFGRSEVTFGYRHMEWDFGSGEPLNDVAFSGPGLRYSYKF